MLDGLRRRTDWLPLPFDCELPREADELLWYRPPDEFGLRRRLPLLEAPLEPLPELLSELPLKPLFERRDPPLPPPLVRLPLERLPPERLTCRRPRRLSRHEL